MSDSPYGPPPPSGDNPYGQQPPQPSGQQPAPGYEPPADNPYAAAPYGQQPAYGGQYPSYGAPAGDPDRRPGTVTAAAIISLVCSGIGFVLFGLLGLALLVARDDLTDDIQAEFQNEPGMENLSPDDIANFGIAIMAVFAIWCLIACVLAVLTMRRSNVARILLVISAAVAALLSLISIFSGLSAITLIAGIAVIVLLFTGGAGAWFASKGSDHHQQQSLPPGTTQPWS